MIRKMRRFRNAWVGAVAIGLLALSIAPPTQAQTPTPGIGQARAHQYIVAGPSIELAWNYPVSATVLGNEYTLQAVGVSVYKQHVASVAWSKDAQGRQIVTVDQANAPAFGNGPVHVILSARLQDPNYTAGNVKYKIFDQATGALIRSSLTVAGNQDGWLTPYARVVMSAPPAP
jgi:hypothetical protein